MEEHKLTIHKPLMPEKPKEKTITLKESTLWKIGFGVVLVLLVAAVWSGGFGLKDGKSAGTITVPTGGSPTGNSRIAVSTDDDPFLGDANAPVTVIEFSDFQCPFCSRFFQQTEPGIKSKYIDTGKVKFVYRDFPLSFHENAEPAALAGECADEQGKFWEFHDKVFQNQASMSDANYKVWAAELGLDTAKFNNCFDSSKYKAEVDKDVAAGSAAGVSGTPTFYIGNDKDGYVQIVGAQPLSVFEQTIDNELK